MRHFAFVVALLTIPATIAVTAAAELDTPPRPAPATISMQKGPPNCSQWTNECVNCQRGAAGETPVCSNIGISCQPKEIRCVSPEPPAK